MEIQLKRIKIDQYDNLIKLIDVDTFFEKSKNKILLELDNYLEDVYLDNDKVIINLEPNEYIDILRNSKSLAESDALIANKLYKEMTFKGQTLPPSIMYEEEVWTYLNLTVFFDLVNERYIRDFKDTDTVLGKIKKKYFNAGGKKDRTGLRYLWIFSQLIDGDPTNKLSIVGCEFKDTVNALIDGCLGKSTIFVQALIEAIILLDKDKRIRNTINRKLIPLHLRNYACPNVVDAYQDVEELANVLAEQMRIVMDNQLLQDGEKQKQKRKKSK